MNYLKSVIKKKSCHLVPKVVIDLPFKGRKVEGSRKYRGRERVPKVGSRREETITEPINSCIGEFHTIVVGKCLTCGTCLQIYIHTYIHTYIYTYIHTYMHTYVHTVHTYIHTYHYARLQP